MSAPDVLGKPRDIGGVRIEAWLKDHAGHWMFVGQSINGPYVGCNNCCSVTNPSDWPVPDWQQAFDLLEREP